MRTKVILFFIMSVFYGMAQNKISYSKDENITFLKTFYSDYMKGIVEKDNYMSKELIQKIERMRTMMNADPIISAQDVTSEMIKTLSVLYLKKQWYKVTYHTSFNNKKEYTNIFVKTDASKILAVYPWQIDIDDMEKTSIPREISNQNNLDFVQTFYENYLNCYLKNNANLEELLKNFQKKYCSSEFQQKIKEIQREYLLDGTDGFDPLIADFDFDKSFLKSLKFSKIDNNKVLMQYKSAFDKEIKLYIYTKKLNNLYLIKDITE